VLAPKLSVLQKRFARKDVSVVAIYIETCDGVPDHAAEFRRQVRKHKIDYAVLDGEAGTLRDPTRKRFPWAPHALVVDRAGRVLRTYGHLPRLATLREDLAALVKTGAFRPRDDDAWREFPRGSWIDVRVEGREPPRTERRRLGAVSPDGVTIQVGRTLKMLRREHKTFDYPHTEKKRATITVDGREASARVFDGTWRRKGIVITDRVWFVDGIVARRQVVESSLDGVVQRERTTRVVKWSDTLAIDGRKVACRVVEKTDTWTNGRVEELVWLSAAVPGHEAKRVRKVVSPDESSTETSTVVALGLR